ncbi:MAG TPA: sigma-70 family RNA polymerase sigma factor [Solirubrobacteraceae bacterium]|nr:sigma-70 family RNA polymerase sigma factor [Solirubrobacteraceae bacterium]
MNPVEELFREHRARVLASLIGFLGDVDRAEEAVQEAFVAALEHWPRDGVPGHPPAWLVTVARRRAVDRIRRERTLQRKLPALLPERESVDEIAEPGEEPIPDERLELIFTCCHPALSLDAQVALTLRTLGGLDTPALARAFLVSPETMKRRLTRAKARVKGCGIPFRVPPAYLLPERLDAVLAVIYLIFNQGYGGPDALSAEALRLGRLLASLMPDEPEPLGLLALMELVDARRAARLDAAGELVLLADQDRSRWDGAGIARGRALLDRALALAPAPPGNGTPARRGRYALQAEIAAAHLQEPIDWNAVAARYAALAGLTGSPVVEISRAVALSQSGDSEAALALLDSPPVAALDEYRYLHSTRGEILARLGRSEEAAAAFARALELAVDEPERRHLARRHDQLARS